MHLIQKSTDLKDVLLYYSIIKDQCPTNRTYVLMSGFIKNENRHQYIKNGGGERDRTDGLLRARQALSQLSYTPE